MYHVHYTALYHVHYTALYHVHYTALYHVHYTALYYVHYTALYYVHCTALYNVHCTALYHIHCTLKTVTLHCPVLHCTYTALFVTRMFTVPVDNAENSTPVHSQHYTANTTQSTVLVQQCKAPHCIQNTNKYSSWQTNTSKKNLQRFCTALKCIAIYF